MRRRPGIGQRTREQDDADGVDIFGAPLIEEVVMGGAATSLSPSRPTSSMSGDAQLTARAGASSPAGNARDGKPVSLIVDEPGRASATGRHQLSLLEEVA